MAQRQALLWVACWRAGGDASAQQCRLSAAPQLLPATHGAGGVHAVLIAHHLRSVGRGGHPVRPRRSQPRPPAAEGAAAASRRRQRQPGRRTSQNLAPIWLLQIRRGGGGGRAQPGEPERAGSPNATRPEQSPVLPLARRRRSQLTRTGHPAVRKGWGGRGGAGGVGHWTDSSFQLAQGGPRRSRTWIWTISRILAVCLPLLWRLGLPGRDGAGLRSLCRCLGCAVSR